MGAVKNNLTDHAEVVQVGRGISWAWLFPFIVLAIGAYMVVTHRMSLGPEIEIRFADAPGIEDGKTSLIFRGVVAGKVSKVVLDPTLNEAVVKVRLNKSAEKLAVKTTEFWIEQPKLSLQGATGLTSLIQGNSLQAKLGSGPPRFSFRGLVVSPVVELSEPTVHVRLKSDEVQSLDRRAPVTFRGVEVGRVREEGIDLDGDPYIDVEILQTYGDFLLTGSRFWVVPATSVTIGPGGITLEFAGIETLVQGGLAFDDFGVGGPPLSDGSVLPVYRNVELARASGEPFIINFKTVRGLRPGQTRVTYLGLPVGIITEMRALDSKVEVTARFEQAYDFLRRTGSEFNLVEPTISVQGVSGLETLITGVVVACTPGTGKGLARRFQGSVPRDSDEVVEQSSLGRQFILVSSSTALMPGSPVLYRELQVGAVLSKKLGRDGRSIELTIGIQSEYTPLVRANSVFWEARGLNGSIGFLNVNIRSATPLPLAGNGAVVFATPDTSAAPARSRAAFNLNDKPRREWTRWQPEIPLKSR